MIRYYLAPMEGITGLRFRQSYAEIYGKADRYFTPFIVGRKLNSREKKELLPENNPNMELVPQILTNKAEDFVYLAKLMRENYGYEEVNLNLGCPSGTVTSKNRGAGFLRVPKELEVFLDYIYTHSPTRISIKTRIGMEDASDWEEILSMYLQFPISELIVHPRTGRQGYGGEPDLEAFLRTIDILTDYEDKGGRHIPLCYNGDVNRIEDRDRILAACPKTDAIMCGRGILMNPDLFGELKNLPTTGKQEHFEQFVHTLYAKYREEETFQSEKNMLFKMKELWHYWCRNFPEPEKTLREVMRASTRLEYEAAVNNAFRSLKL